MKVSSQRLQIDTVVLSDSLRPVVKQQGVPEQIDGYKLSGAGRNRLDNTSQVLAFTLGTNNVIIYLIISPKCL